MMSPEQVKLPTVPSRVHPVSADPPERAIEPAAPVGPMFKAVVAPAKRLKVVAVVVKLLPLTARSPAVVIFHELPTSKLSKSITELAPEPLRIKEVLELAT